MFVFRLLLPFFALAIAGCATTGAAPQPDPVFLVLRHLHTPQGERDPDLTAEGHAAAERLAELIAPSRPTAIYVTPFKRTQRTAAPLAARLELTPIVYDPADTPGLLARVRGSAANVVIVGHSNTVPDIVAGLGGERPAPLSHPNFGDIWQVGPAGRTERLRVP